MIPDIISVKRKYFTNKSTIGQLTFNDFHCFTLEDTVRRNGFKIAGETAIPPGEYEVIVNYSERFKQMMPLILNVPNFQGIRIHPGNTEKDTDGCILVGNNYNPDIPDLITDSRAAFNILFPLIKNSMLTSKVFLAIS